jgi:hypothetical protein
MDNSSQPDGHLRHGAKTRWKLGERRDELEPFVSFVSVCMLQDPVGLPIPFVIDRRPRAENLCEDASRLNALVVDHRQIVVTTAVIKHYGQCCQDYISV